MNNYGNGYNYGPQGVPGGYDPMNNFPMNGMGMPGSMPGNGFYNQNGYGTNWTPGGQMPAPIYNPMTGPAPTVNPVVMTPYGVQGGGVPGMNPMPGNPQPVTPTQVLVNPATGSPVAQQPIAVPVEQNVKAKKEKKPKNKVRVKGVFSTIFALIYCLVFFIGYAPFDAVSDYIVIYGGQNGADYIGQLITGVQQNTQFITVLLICACTAFVVLNLILNLFSIRSKKTFGFIKYINFVILLLLVAFVAAQCLSVTIEEISISSFGIGLYILSGDVVAMFLSAIIGK